MSILSSFIRNTRHMFEPRIGRQTASVTSSRRCGATYVRRQYAFGRHRFHALASIGGRCLLLAQMLEHLGGGPEGGDRIGDPFAGNIECRAMDWLEHRGIAPLGIDVGCRRHAEAARKRAGKVGQNVGVKIGGDDRVEAAAASVSCAPS